MNTEHDDKLARERELRDVAFERTFTNAFDTANELNALLAGPTLADGGAMMMMVPVDLIRRVSVSLSFCAGYAAGAAPTEAIRAQFRRLS